MPGIAGIISKMPRGRSKKDLHLMINCMMHETFYTSGTYINDQLGLYAGWVCHKGSFSDCMSIFNEKKDLVLLFSGENFADKEVTDQLKRHGHEFDDFNASYLIHLYEEDEDRFLQSLNGWFSGILVDLHKAKVILFNDRYGMQRIYYYENKDTFLFSSEAKSLLKVCPELRKIDMRSLGEFFSCGCVIQQNRTLFSNVFLLPGGSAWTFCNGNSLKKDSYFKPSIWENQPVLEKEIYYERLRETFHNVLQRYFYSDTPIGASLTGGFDTRMIMSCMDHPSGKLPCYTFAGMYRDTFDVRVARKVANKCHQAHHVLRLDREFFSNFPGYAEKTVYITDGCLDICGSHDIFFNRLAREIAPIRMTGKFGSEVLRSHSMFKTFSPCEGLFHPDFNKYLLEARAAHNEIKMGHKLSFAVFKEMPLHEFGCLAIERSQLTQRTPYMDNDLVELVYQAPADTCTSNEISQRLIADSNPALNAIKTDRGFGGESNHLFSKCAQLFHWSLCYAEWYTNSGMPHWLAKLDYTFRPLHLDRLILGWDSFLHYRKWFSNELSDYVKNILLDKHTSSRPYLNKKYLEEIVNCHIKGKRNYTGEINRILTTEQIYRLLIEQ